MNSTPAFLFYTGDWFKITQGLNHKLRGMFLELIIYQFNNGFIPNDIEEISYILNIDEAECKKVFKHLSKKLILVNRSDNQEVYQQSDFQKVFDANLAKSHKNKILSHYAVLIKKSKLNFKHKELIKREFDINNFIKLDIEIALKNLTVWFTERLTNIEEVNEDEKENKDVIHIEDAYDFLKNKEPEKIEIFEMQNKSSFIDYNQFIINFNSVVIEKSLDWEPEILLARLKRLNSNWDKTLKTTNKTPMQKLKERERNA